MTLALTGLGLATALELLLWIRALWRLRSILASLAIASLGVGSIALIATHPSFWTVLVLIMSGYRTINMLRVVRGRTMADYLYIVARGTTLWLVLAQTILLWGAWLTGLYSVRGEAWWYVLAVLELIGALVLARTTIHNSRKAVAPEVAKGIADKDLPSLTVAIPARNETEDLSACLESLVASTYPKLEVLVLDDCSQNKRTPQIIRSFAHAGVRFISGQSAPPNWLAKNFAYEQLFNQSNGELILFCGVDARFEPESLHNIVTAMLLKKKDMCSIMPANQRPHGLFQALLQPSRYAWELSLPRRLINRPPILSTCWIATRELIQKSGTFKATTRSIIPERHLAALATNHDGYSFMQSNTALGVSNDKAFSEQRDTAIRTRYPQLHRRPELTCFHGVITLLVLVVPYVVLARALLVHQAMLAMLAVLTVASLTIFYSEIVTITYRRLLLRSLWTLPLAAIYDVALLNYSMWKYEFSTVLWKGRNVCIPVMHVIPHLPPLDNPAETRSIHS
ncbi:MAG: hypothetical protein JWO41_674 [Candidatus Saccharibacteria bacterium]|nr:hypothetical protein [Candidatus Saccharibacteria bacterium]